MNVSERRERLIRILELRVIASIKYLSEELEVSERTILRDVSTLSSSRPIYTIPGKHGGVFLMKSYERDTLRLSSYEIAILEKIIKDYEEKKSLTLGSWEIQMLKNIVAAYSGKGTVRKEK